MSEQISRLSEEQQKNYKLSYLLSVLPWIEVALQKLIDKNEICMNDLNKCTCGYLVKAFWNYCPNCSAEL